MEIYFWRIDILIGETTILIVLLRNLWQLSRYVPAEKMQVEFLNKWRNADKYADNDIFAPKSYSFDYLFGITAAAQPLAWMEASNLPQDAYKVSPTDRELQKDTA